MQCILGQATRMHLPWTHSKAVKLRALCFWAPGAVAVFTPVQSCSGEGCQTLPCSAHPAQRVLTQPRSDLELLSLPVPLWCPFWSELWTPLPRALLNLDVSHFPWVSAAQADPGKRPVSFCCVQLSDLQETVLLLSILLSRALRRKAQSQVPVVQESHPWMICSP